ncbi:MAG: TonB-dependent receptor plug domain-containing protein, partial [Bacteroidia bacterium]
DLVKDIQLYKSSIPEKFGGRISSVLEVRNREGDKSKIKGTAGIGLITSRFNIEGPIDSGRTSFIFGGRGTYSNWMMKLLPEEYRSSKASFYDVNLGIDHQINEKNSISISGYYSKDNFNLNADTNYYYSNRNASIKWNHIFNKKLNGALTAGSDFYEYSIKSNVNPINAYNLNFNINQGNLKYDLLFIPNQKHKLNLGVSTILYKLNPGNYTPLGGQSLVITDIVPAEQALESAIFLGDQYDVNNNFSINAGIRFSVYNYLGPQTVRRYAENLPVSEATLLETEAYSKNTFIKTYGGPEVRLSARYSFSPSLSVKASFNTLRQYMHLLSNTTAIAPTDIWKLSDPNIKPQIGNQISIGIYKNFKDQDYGTSVEVYYKNLNNFLDFKSGASLVLNKRIETDVISTKGRAYGLEFFMKKNYGKLSGWISYAYSRTQLKMDDLTLGSLVNDGNFYPANYDKPHAFNLTSNYRIKHRYHFSLNVTYSTGRPITLPIAKYSYAGAERVFYSERNAYRIPDYFRTDISFNIEGNHKLNQQAHNSYTVGLYNLTGRKNPYSVYFTQEGGKINGYKLSIFANVIPFINYNIRF